MRNNTRWMLRQLIRLLAQMRRKCDFPPILSSPRSIAYFAAGGISDCIMAWPALQLIKKSFPDTRLLLFVPAKARAIITEAFNDIEVSAKASTRFPLLVRPRFFDVALGNTIGAFYLTTELNAVMAAQRSYGFRYPGQPEHHRLYDASLPIEPDVHDIDQNRRLAVMALGLNFTMERFHYGTSDGIKREGTVVIHPGVRHGYEQNMWPVERFVELAGRISRAGHTVTVLCGPSEQHLQPAFSSLSHVTCMMNASPVELLRCIRSARLFIGNDSGPAHLAAFYNTPAITLIGPTDHYRHEPRGTASISIHTTTDRSPSHVPLQQCTDNCSMKNITVEQIWRETAKLLRIQ